MKIDGKLEEMIELKDRLSLPISFEPSFWGRLKGESGFSVGADEISWEDAKGKQKLFLKNIVETEVSSNSFSLIDKDNQRYFFKCGSKSNFYLGLVNRLCNEIFCHENKITNSNISIDEGYKQFLDSFSYIGNPYVKAVEILLKTAIDNNFSDIHFEPAKNEIVRVSYRNSGKLNYLSDLKQNDYSHFLARIKYLAGCHSHSENIAQEGAFHFCDSDLRLSTFPTDLGERTSIRVISSLKFKTVEDLGWEKSVCDAWINSIKNSRGLYLLIGPVGSGKTTAMYATISQLVNSMEGQVRAVSIEDPVEAFVEGICQSSYDSKTEKSLASAFKHLLRQDPDIIALGEIRDAESITEALQAGLSGHLVLATFHAGSAEEAIDRIKLMATGNELILTGLRGIMQLNLSYENGCAKACSRVKLFNNGRLFE